MNSNHYLLLVEDDVPLGENLEELLVDAGHDVVRCLCAEQALGRSDLEQCRGVITDFRLPGLNGLELLEELRRRNLGPPCTPCMVVSASTDDGMTARANASGAEVVLTKPIPLHQLLDWAEHPH